MLAVAGRLYHFTRPPDDAHEWRQTQTLMYSASYSDGAGWLTPTSNWNGLSAHAAVLELPVYSLLAHWLSAVVSLLTAARLLSFLFSVAALVVFDRLCASLGHPRRQAATLLFAFAPIVVFYGHATQPDSLLLLMVLVAAFCAVRQGTSWWWIAGAILSLAIAATIKPTALVVLAPPLLYLGWKRKQLTRQTIVLLAAALAVIAWAAFVRSVLLMEDPAWYRAATDPSWLWGPLAVRYSPQFYLILLSRLLLILLPPGAAVLIYVAARRNAGHPFWWWWGLGSVASVLVFAALNEWHFYYQLPVVPALAALAGYAAPRWPTRFAGRLALAVCLVLTVTVASASLYGEQPIYYDAGTALAAASNPDEPVVVLSQFGTSPWWPTVLYYAGRDGWNLPLNSDAARIAALPGPTPCTLVIVRDEPGPTVVPAGWQETGRSAEYVLARNLSCSSTTGG
jgi:4-amino-4-deoxy-L-arabinose transferase-like glycosyltransferase